MARYWLSFDLGLTDDVDPLYAWLDGRGAKDCGEATATFASEEPREAIEAELKALLAPTQIRAYLVGGDASAKGRFVNGKRRKRPHWAGFATEDVDEDG